MHLSHKYKFILNEFAKTTHTAHNSVYNNQMNINIGMHFDEAAADTAIVEIIEK